MKKYPTSTQFKFVLSTEETLKNLDELRMSNYDRFVLTTYIGKKIQYFANDNLHKELYELCNKHLFNIPFLKFYIEDAFVSAFNLRNYEVIKYFLENGFDLNEHVEDAVVNIAYSLEYLNDPKEAPVELLSLAYYFLCKKRLQFGANPRYCESDESNTALHFAAMFGNSDFIKILVEYGGDINAVNDNKQTPLEAAMNNKKSKVKELIKFLGGKMYDDL